MGQLGSGDTFSIWRSFWIMYELKDKKQCEQQENSSGTIESWCSYVIPADPWSQFCIHSTAWSPKVGSRWIGGAKGPLPEDCNHKPDAFSPSREWTRWYETFSKHFSSPCKPVSRVLRDTCRNNCRDSEQWHPFMRISWEVGVVCYCSKTYILSLLTGKTCQFLNIWNHRQLPQNAPFLWKLILLVITGLPPKCWAHVS